MNPVAVTDELRMLPAYGFPPAEELPLFAENRIHQRSSGNPYPAKAVLTVDRAHRGDRPFRVITLENEYLRVELMPELGGRIYAALDKRTGYDFFYKQHVVKPALIGLLGSWVSGGVEFNWPCHHRPSSFMPVDVSIEREEGGAVTVWMSENEPLDRMKGMVGVRLAPGEARLDTRMRVYNRTPARHSFLWWENAAVPVNTDYRLIFPPDVSYVQFHYRKNVTGYPVASGVYNGIRMGEGTDISYHKNTHQPTSYFCAETKYDFFGGYDEGRRCGVIHVADHTVSVGKKMFTWAYNQLSRSWERALTDTDGPYAELMASSYSLNQPDFAWLMPYEGREFSQMWYPVGGIGLPLCACREAVLSAEGGRLALEATVPLENASLCVNGGESVRFSASPEAGFALPLDGELRAFTLRDAGGRVLLRYEKPAAQAVRPMPDTLPDNPTLDALHTAQELYLAGVHAQQYRDPATDPAAYWREAVRRDPEYVPALTALAEDELRHFRPEAAMDYAMRAWKKVTMRNFHPESGQLPYVIARIHEALGEDGEASEWYRQAAWAQDSRSRALTRAAMLRGRAGDQPAMAELAREALAEHARNETAVLALAVALGDDPAAQDAALRRLEAYDRLNPACRALRLGASPEFYAGLGADACQTVLDVCEELSLMGETALAAQLLRGLPQKTAQTEYVRAYLTGDDGALHAAAGLGTGVAFPSRAIELRALQSAVAKAPGDANARGLLACLLYANGHHDEAAALWEEAAALDPENPAHPRNLAVASYSHLGRREDALPLLRRALALHPHDGQLIFETAHVMLRTHQPPQEVAELLAAENCPREDVRIEHCRALNLCGRYEEALSLMLAAPFTPCEGGEHAVAAQYMFAHHALGRKALASGDVQGALAHFTAAKTLPESLGAGLWNAVLLVPHRHYEAVCLRALGRGDEADAIWTEILSIQKDYFTDMNLPELPCWQAMACRALGRDAQAQALIAAHVRAQEAAARAVCPGWAGTTPFFLSYMEDPQTVRRGARRWQLAMAHFAAGDTGAAAQLAREALGDDPVNLYATLMI